MWPAFRNRRASGWKGCQMIFSKRLRSQEHVVSSSWTRRMTGWEVRGRGSPCRQAHLDARLASRRECDDEVRSRGDAAAARRLGRSSAEYRLNWDAGRQRAGDRRLICYLEQLGLLLGINRFTHRNLPFDSPGLRHPSAVAASHRSRRGSIACARCTSAR